MYQETILSNFVVIFHQQLEEIITNTALR